MEKIRKNFGFGCMRLPMIGEDVDMEQTKQMVDCFLEQGFNYFDTAHGYLQGKSELADKLSGSYFKKEEDIRPFFESQLAACGVDYFDFYLMHSQSTTNYQHYRDCRAYETAFALKAEGKVRHVGISFHDRAAVLEQILTDYPAIEVVQIQFNYLDYDDVAVQSRKCYEVCRRHGKPVLVMEPVKGGSLVNLPDDAKAVLDALHGGSRGLPRYADGAVRHEQHGADAGQPELHEGLYAAERCRAYRRFQGGGDLPQAGSDPLHVLPLLHRRLPEAYLHPRPVRHHEHEAHPPRLECGLLL